LSISMDLLDEVFDVFINGVRVGTHGRWEPARTGKFPRIRSFPIPEAARQGAVAHVAIRRWTGASRTNFASLSAAGLSVLTPPEIGPARLVDTRAELVKASTLNRYALNRTVSLLTIIVGLLSLALYYAHQGSRQNQWLGLALISEGLPPLLGLI